MNNQSNPNPDPNNPHVSSGPFTTPLSQRGWPSWSVYLLAALAAVYLLNPTAGVLELIPDNLPIIGNLDEGAAMLMLWYALVEFTDGRKKWNP